MKMKTKTLLPMFVLIALLFVTGGASAQPLNKAEGSNAASVSLGTAFTYQGRLTDTSGNPKTGPCDFQFTLYDAASGGNVVGSAQTKTNVSLNNGYFSVELDFGATAFQGDARWMAISVACPTGGVYTPLTGRVALTAAPYALSLRPGASIQSAGAALNLSTSATTGFALNVVATGASAIYGQGGSSTGAGVTGFNTSAASTASGVTGLNGGNGSGVFGQTVSGRGVYGKATDLVNSYGVYSEGNAYVDGNLGWKAKTGYIAVSAAAFRPVRGTYNYQNWGNMLTPDDSSSPYYYAPVQLPHGATVIALAFTWQDYSAANDAMCRLYRNSLDGGGSAMATVSSSDSLGNGSSGTLGVTGPVVANDNYAYFLEWYLPNNNTSGYAVLIIYTFTGPY